MKWHGKPQIRPHLHSFVMKMETGVKQGTAFECCQRMERTGIHSSLLSHALGEVAQTVRDMLGFLYV